MHPLPTGYNLIASLTIRASNFEIYIWVQSSSLCLLIFSLDYVPVMNMITWCYDSQNL